jgi:hypothetical protein
MQFKTTLAIAAFATLGTLAKAQDKSSEKDILTIYKGAHSYKEVSVAGKTTEVYVDDRQVAGSEIAHYDSLIRVMRADVDAENRDLARSGEEDARDDAQGDRDREQADRDRENARSERDREQAGRDLEQSRKDREQGERDREQGQRDREQGRRDREQAKQDRARMREIIQFVLDKKIVPDQAHLNGMVLTDTAFYVNGVKQPASIHQALKEKYPDWARYGISYGNGCALGVNIHMGGCGDCWQ